jgi:predicted enzyme related to lactoylglutathione lyase
MTETPQAPLNTVTWWELPVTDIAAAQRFYGDVFGWTYTSFGDDDAYSGITYAGALIGGLYRADDVATGATGASGAAAAPGVRTYINVADLEATFAAAERAGGSVRTPRTEVGGDMGWWAELSDPDGRWIGLCTGNPPAPDAPPED